MKRVSFNGNPSIITISCCRPTNDIDETDTITFYNEPSSLAQHVPKHNVLIGGDMDAQISKDETNKILFNSSNGNGEYLIDFSPENRLTFLNIKFQK